MKIFFVTSKLNFLTAGGSIEEIDLIIKTLINLGNEVTVVTAFSSKNKITDPLPYKVHEEMIKSYRLLSVQMGVLKILKKYSSRADIFIIDAHLFMYGAGFYRKMGGRVPVVGFFNQFLICWPQCVSSLFKQPKQNFFNLAKGKIRWWLEKYVGMRLANSLDYFAFVSPALMAMYKEFGIRNNHKCLVLGDPVDIKKIMEENKITPNSYRLRNKKTGSINLFFSSRMSPGKGFDILLAGFSKIKNKENFRLILGGSGPEEKQVRKMVEDLGLQKYVTIPGWVTKEQLYRYYSEADIFIQADWWLAGTSISLYYAMAFGVPSILPGGGGLEWQAKNSALYFKRRDLNDLANKIEQLAGDYELRAELSRQCYERLNEDEMNYKENIAELNRRMEKAINLKQEI
ncbi:MAG: glycosyltransferase family 4 protein [bacterium]|nr:glycosyltransferase family 4 protein [bacterium]